MTTRVVPSKADLQTSGVQPLVQHECAGGGTGRFAIILGFIVGSGGGVVCSSKRWEGSPAPRHHRGCMYPRQAE